MTQKKLEKALLICKDSDKNKSKETKQLLEAHNIPYTEFASENEETLSLIAVPGYQVVRGYSSIVAYVNSVKSKN